MICPDCKQNPPDLIEEDADTICNNCGRVLAERLVSYESEWRTFNNDEKGGDDPNRVGEAENPLLYGNAGTTIGGGGANLSKETRKLKKAQQLVMGDDSQNKALNAAYSTIDAWGDADNMPSNVRKRAQAFYKQVHSAQYLRGKPINTILAGCLFIAARECNFDRSFAEIVNITRVPKKEIGRIYKQLNKFFTAQAEELAKQLEDEGLTAAPGTSSYLAPQSSQPAQLIPRYCNLLGGPFAMEKIALGLAEQVKNIPTLAGRSPLSVAGACIYFASHLIGRGKSYSELTPIIVVSDATIKAAYKNLLAEKDKLIKDEWLGPQPGNTYDKPCVGDIKNLPNN